MATDSDGAQDDTAELSLSLRLQFRVSGASLFQPEFPGTLPASRNRRDPGAGLFHDVCGVRIALVLFLPAHRAPGSRGERLALAAAEGPSSNASRKQIVGDVAVLRHAGEVKSYIDLLFLALVILLCIAKIVTN